MLTGFLKKLLALKGNKEMEKLDNESVDYADDELIIGNEAFKVEDIEFIELRHHLKDQRMDLVDVLVTSHDRSPRVIFSKAATKQDFLGTATDNSKILKEIKSVANAHDLKVFET
ncbi:hypothetical protein [Pseudomonas putida]|uniref:hypothetical protein n=1 Tax=Pseudomonas putida TaxID=303 RepID=UPI0023638CFE|nr:hypothetical protein [Pseudomonas putida]MDD2003623.1 hypothetical protein [Pseudomonas putida]